VVAICACWLGGGDGDILGVFVRKIEAFVD
jgi:hypothetical protein